MMARMVIRVFVTTARRQSWKLHSNGQSYENRVQKKGNLFLFYAEMHELRDFLSQSYEKSFRFLQSLCGKDAVRMQIFKFFNLKSFIKTEIIRNSASVSRKIFVTLHPIYKKKYNLHLKYL